MDPLRAEASRLDEVIIDRDEPAERHEISREFSVGERTLTYQATSGGGPASRTLTSNMIDIASERLFF
jgi:hypothetical protein